MSARAKKSVSVAPGIRQVTVTPLSFSSLRSAAANESTNALVPSLTALKLEGSSGKALRQAMAATRRGGVVSVPGVYAGFIHGFLFGDAFEKGLTFKGGQTHTQGLMPELLTTSRKGG